MKYNSKESSIFFEFLRFCIHDDAVEPVSLDSMDWDALYDFGNRQAILGVLYRGLMKLSKSNFRPDRLQILNGIVDTLVLRRQINRIIRMLQL